VTDTLPWRGSKDLTLTTTAVQCLKLRMAACSTLYANAQSVGVSAQTVQLTHREHPYRCSDKEEQSCCKEEQTH